MKWDKNVQCTHQKGVGRTRRAPPSPSPHLQRLANHPQCFHFFPFRFAAARRVFPPSSGHPPPPHSPRSTCLFLPPPDYSFSLVLWQNFYFPPSPLSRAKFTPTTTRRIFINPLPSPPSMHFIRFYASHPLLQTHGLGRHSLKLDRTSCCCSHKLVRSLPAQIMQNNNSQRK